MKKKDKKYYSFNLDLLSAYFLSGIKRDNKVAFDLMSSLTLQKAILQP